MGVSAGQIEEARFILAERPRAGRYTLMDELGIKEHEAREIIAKIKNEPEPYGGFIRYAAFDLECTDLAADVGGILVGCVFSSIDGKMHVFRQDEIPNKRGLWDDGPIAVAIRDFLEKHHILCSWYGRGYDVSFLNTRLVKWGERTIQPHFHIDPIFQYRSWRGLKPRNSKMSTVAEFYDLDDRKPSVDVEVWRRAATGDKESMDELVDRCEADVRITAKLVEKTLDNNLMKSIQRYP